jgi:hypothetical protein
MKVKYIGTKNEGTNKGWLSVGIEYIVLEILTSVRKGVSYRLVGDNDDKMPAIFEADQFDITSDKVPSNWIVKIDRIGSVDLSPAAWFREGFWEDCYDGDPAALEIYKQEARIIYDEEGGL